VTAGQNVYAANELHIHEAAKASFSLLHQLPSPPANFTGRDEDLAELEKELADAHTAGATISGRHAGLQGMGGVGKTALATVLAHRLKDHYRDAQLYLNLRGSDPDHRAPVTPAEAMQSIIHVFHPEAKLPEALDQLTTIYHGVLNEAGRVLLFLDNAANGEQVKPLLPPANCLLLVTSREHFSLPGMVRRNIDCLLPEKSQELLLKLAERIKSCEQAAAELCGHLPLALEVFAGVVNDNELYSVPDLLERLRQQPAKLTKAEAAFQVSYDLLAEDKKRCWTLLSVFPASFDLRAATAVWESVAAVYDRRGENVSGDSAVTDRRYNEARETMQALFKASLVERNQANERLRLHDLVRAFCLGKVAAGEMDAARHAHARHYTKVGKEADELYKMKGKHIDGLALFDRERVQIEAAYAWLVGRKDEVAAGQMIALVNAVVYTGQELRFHPRQRIAWRVSQLRAAHSVKDRSNKGAALRNIGLAYADLGDVRRAIGFHERALAIDREICERLGESRDLGNLGKAYAHLGDARKAIEFCEQQLVIAREIGDRRGEGNALGNLGVAHKKLGDMPKAIKFYEQYRDIAREISDRRGEGTALGNLGNAYADLGDARKAIEFYEQALVIARELRDRHREGTWLGNLGNAHKNLGDARKAIELYEQQLVIAREIGDRRGEGDALWNSAEEFMKMGNRAEAIPRAEAALKIYEAIEDPNAAMVRAKLAKWRAAKP
jgi:tetratricopeptide (TPR) repeat protein